MRYYHDQHIGVYENAISDEWCDKVIEYFENNIEDSNHRFPNEKKRDSSMSLKDTFLSEHFLNTFENVFYHYSYRYPFIPEPLELNTIKIQKTFPTEGYHDYHIEYSAYNYDFYRVAVYTVYLNDIEEGGETEFLYQLKRLKPKKGTICIFPAGYTHVHRGNTPFLGEKYILTGWLEIPKRKKLGS